MTEFERLRNVVETLGVGELTDDEWTLYRAMLKDPSLRERPVAS